MPANKILAFPIQLHCPTCLRPCGADELSACLRCGHQYCQRDEWTCECDRFAAEMADRAKHRLTGEPIREPAEENVVAEQFIKEQFGGVL